MTLIDLTQGRSAVVDREDYERLSQWKWHAHESSGQPGIFYAVRTTPRISGKQRTIFMHREILGLTAGDKRHVDHQNLDTLDNRKSNLRIASQSQNQANRRTHQNNTSGYKGVTLNRGRWTARIGINGVKKHLGCFDTPEQAANAYRRAALDHYGQFARTEKKG